ncbi:YlxR family protein [Spiractinospora alimapuensis]|uniref:YlxR family protein n=1 Tax=Spiractinospora alimapuensis TaxID=2820884 RepID=UPI001F3B2440|nr:YlxR family protein [Spiractinospora alimapuensis]QVQ53661.1 YlxR family protein [Spiractinospora alimapuensis]
MPPRTEAGTTVGPVRTCVGCRRREAQDVLLRVALVDGRALPDPGRVLPGRGAYVHPDAACVDRASKRRAWQRALRSRGCVDAGAVRDAVVSEA